MTYIVKLKDTKMTIECGNDERSYLLEVLPEEEEMAEQEINEIIKKFILYNIRKAIAE